MPSLAFGGLTLLCIIVSSALATETTTVLGGSSVKISCVSSFPPTWYNSKDGTIKSLSATGTKPHPKLNELRYSFYEKSGEYFLEIAKVQNTDAGKFICDGDLRSSTTMTVIRYGVILFRKKKREKRKIE